MKYSRSELKYAANDAVYLTRPRAAFVTIVYLLIVLVISGIFNVVSPNPMGAVTDSVTDVVEEFAESSLNFDDPDFSFKDLISLFTDTSQPSVVEQILVQLFDEYEINPLDENAFSLLAGAVFSAGLALSLLSWLIGLVSKLITTVLEYGYRSYTLSVFRHQPTSFRQLFCAFPRFGLIAGSWVLVGVFSFLWSLIPAVVGSALLAAAMFIFADSIALLPVAAVLVIAMIVAPIILTNRYALTPYAILEQPELGVFGCIKRSKELMKKNCWHLFFLNFSFIGWRILVALSYVIIPALGLAVSAVCFSFSLTMAGKIALLVTLFLSIVVPIPAAVWLEGYQMTARSGFYHFTLTGNLKPTARDQAAARAEAEAETESVAETPCEEVVADTAEETPAEEIVAEVTEDSPVKEPTVEEPAVEEESVASLEDILAEHISDTDVPVE